MRMDLAIVLKSKPFIYAVAPPAPARAPVIQDHSHFISLR